MNDTTYKTNIHFDLADVAAALRAGKTEREVVEAIKKQARALVRHAATNALRTAQTKMKAGEL